MKPASEAFEEIQREYELHHEGWRMYAGFDSGGQATVYAFHSDYAWTIKYPKYGMNGLAGKVKIEEDELIREIAENPMSFGLRIITNHMLEVLIKTKDRNLIASHARPVSGREITNRLDDSDVAGVMQGPLLTANGPLAPVSRSQISLEQKLKKDLEHLTDGLYL